MEHLIKKIKNKEFTVGVIGLGYVGLPLIHTFHSTGMPVIGLDVDKSKIRKLNEGIPYIKHFGLEVMSYLSESAKAKFSTDFSIAKFCDALILCVPTPLSQHRDPNMKYVIESSKSIAKYLRKDQIIILESTTYPGTMDELVIPILESSGLKVGHDFYVAYSPEREDPGNKDYNTASIPKVVGGYSENCLKLAIALYETCIEKLVPVSNTKTAEAVKITENIFRAVNIALVNELKIVYSRMNIDVNEVLDAASSKPFGFMKFNPGPGIGGHCIPIDPFYLTWKAKEFDINTRFIELAGQINSLMPEYVIDKLQFALNGVGKALSQSKILVIGLAYKPDVDDYRESPSFKLFNHLKKNNAKFDFHDNLVPKIGETREHSEYTGMISVDLNKKNIKEYDAILISTNHTYIDYSLILENAKLIIDTRNCFEGVADKKLFRA